MMKKYICFLLGLGLGFGGSTSKSAQDIETLRVKLERFGRGVKKASDCQTGDVGAALFEANNILQQIERMNSDNSEVVKIKKEKLKEKLLEKISYIESQYKSCSVNAKSMNPGEKESFEAMSSGKPEQIVGGEIQYNAPPNIPTVSVEHSHSENTERVQ